MIEGAVRISIRDFDKLRDDAESYKKLVEKIAKCSEVEYKDLSADEWIQVVKINAEEITQIVKEYAAFGKEDVEEIYEDSKTTLINLRNVIGVDISPNKQILLNAGYPLDEVLKYTEEEAETEISYFPEYQ